MEISPMLENSCFSKSLQFYCHRVESLPMGPQPCRLDLACEPLPSGAKACRDPTGDGNASCSGPPVGRREGLSPADVAFQY